MGLALGANPISIRLGISVARVEILVGVVVGNLHPAGQAPLLHETEWTKFLAMLGSGVLTFLAGLASAAKSEAVLPAYLLRMGKVSLKSEGRAVAFALLAGALAAFYFSPELDLARAQWGTAQAGLVTAGQRPNPTLSASPQYNVTTLTPSPWIAAVNLDLPLETAGKRGHRLAQARHLSEAAGLNIASVAWRVRGKVRRALVDWGSAGELERLLALQQGAQEQNVKLLEAQFAVGAVSAAEVTRERIALETTRLAAQEARRQQAESRVALAAAIGVPVSALDGVEISLAGLDRLPPELDAPTAPRWGLHRVNSVLRLVGQWSLPARSAGNRLRLMTPTKTKRKSVASHANKKSRRASQAGAPLCRTT